MSAAVPATERLAHLWVLSGLLLLALLGCNRGLWTPDEPREAEISRGDGAIAGYAIMLYFERPALH